MTHTPTAAPATRPAPAPAPAKGANGFEALGLSPATAAALARQDITTPSPIQALTIPDALAGRDVCGKARTGSGKTLAFGLPLLERVARSEPGRPGAIVLVPTRELARQVAEAFAPVAQQHNRRVFAIFGGVPLPPQARALRNGVDVVIATPGRFNDLVMRGVVSCADVRVAVIDEADHMADLGFLPQVERILDRVPTGSQVLLFSATLDGDVDRLVRKYQDDPAYHEAPVDDEGETAMAHRFIGVEPAEKVAVAAAIAAGPERTIFFVRTQRAADRLAVQLGREGVAAGTLHGRLSQPRRERALNDFASGRISVLVATNIAARGIHVDGVDIVVHHDPPEDTKTFLHRSGRTARAGAAGIVVTLVEPEQRRDVDALRRGASIREAVVPMGPRDPRLADLAGWTPPLETAPPPQAPRNGGGGGGRPRYSGPPRRYSGPRR